MNDLTKIPHGCYCYDERGVCPFWSTRKRHKGHRLGNQECGYCSYLGKGDWDMNREVKWVRIYHKDGTRDATPTTAAEIGMSLSLLWDQVKECDINTYDAWDITLELGVYGI